MVKVNIKVAEKIYVKCQRKVLYAALAMEWKSFQLQFGPIRNRILSYKKFELNYFVGQQALHYRRSCCTLENG